MKAEFDGNEIKITCTFSELATAASVGEKLYATPTTDGRIAELYWNSSPSFQDDRVVATPNDFAKAAGLTSLGWEDLTEEDFDSVREDDYSLTIPNRVGTDEDAELWTAEQKVLAAEREACRAK